MHAFFNINCLEENYLKYFLKKYLYKTSYIIFLGIN